MDELSRIYIVIPAPWLLLVGVIWSLIGIQVLDRCADRHGEALAWVFGDAAHSRAGWLMGWIFIALWPLGAFVVLIAEAGYFDEF